MSKQITFAALPDWVFPAKPDALALYEAIALAGLEGQWIRLSADTQRRLIGSNVFGKQEMRLNADGTFEVIISTCFGADSEQSSYSANVINGAASAGKRLSPGYSGAAADPKGKARA